MQSSWSATEHCTILWWRKEQRHGLHLSKMKRILAYSLKKEKKKELILKIDYGYIIDNNNNGRKTKKKKN